MANKRNAIVLNVDLNSAGALKGLKKLGGAAGGLGVGALAGAAGILALGTAMGVATAKASGHAAKLELIQNKSRVVFGDQLPMIQAWSSNLASAFGLTEVSLTGISASFADLLIPLGFARTEAANMTTKVVGLAGAMSEWSAGQRTVTETTRILARAMLGEREMLKDLGVDIRELDITQRLASKGQENLTGNILKQAKAVATMEMIFERSRDAQTAYAQGSDSLFRKSNQLKASFSELVQELEIQLTPSFASLVDVLIDEVMPVIEGELFPLLQDLIKNFTQKLPGAISTFTDVLKGDLIPNVQNAGEAVVDFTKDMGDAIAHVEKNKKMYGLLAIAIAAVAKPLGGTSRAMLGLTGIMALLGISFDDLGGWVKKAAGGMDFLTEKSILAAGGIKKAFTTAFATDQGGMILITPEQLENIDMLPGKLKEVHQEFVDGIVRRQEQTAKEHELDMEMEGEDYQFKMKNLNLLWDQQAEVNQKYMDANKEIVAYEAWMYDQREEHLTNIWNEGEKTIKQIKQQRDFQKELNNVLNATAVATSLISQGYTLQTPEEQARRLEEAVSQLQQSLKLQDEVKKLAKIIEIMAGISTPQIQEQKLFADRGPNYSADFRRDADDWSKQMLMGINHRLNWGGDLKNDKNMIALFSHTFKRESGLDDDGTEIAVGRATQEMLEGFVKHMLTIGGETFLTPEAQMRRTSESISAQAKNAAGEFQDNPTIIVQAPVTDPQAIANTIVDVLRLGGYNVEPTPATS